ncbi:MAG: hypothetical protein WA807_12995 [Steroidobacteraceae bacterium]
MTSNTRKRFTIAVALKFFAWAHKHGASMASELDCGRRPSRR